MTRYQYGACSVVSRGKVVCFLRLLSQWLAILNLTVVNVLHGQVQKWEQKHSLAAVIVYSQERISQNERK